MAVLDSERQTLIFLLLVCIIGIIFKALQSNENIYSLLIILKSDINTLFKNILNTIYKMMYIFAYILQSIIILFISGIYSWCMLGLILCYPAVALILVYIDICLVLYHLSGGDITDIPYIVFNYLKVLCLKLKLLLKL